MGVRLIMNPVQFVSSYKKDTHTQDEGHVTTEKDREGLWLQGKRH